MAQLERSVICHEKIKTNAMSCVYAIVYNKEIVNMSLPPPLVIFHPLGHVSYTRSHIGLLFLLWPKLIFRNGHSVFELFRGGEGSGYLSRLLLPPYKPSS
jgi:hypothetical protein